MLCMFLLGALFLGLGPMMFRPPPRGVPSLMGIRLPPGPPPRMGMSLPPGPPPGLPPRMMRPPHIHPSVRTVTYPECVWVFVL